MKKYEEMEIKIICTDASDSIRTSGENERVSFDGEEFVFLPR